jgi:hypothetical protein
LSCPSFPRSFDSSCCWGFTSTKLWQLIKLAVGIIKPHHYLVFLKICWLLPHLHGDLVATITSFFWGGGEGCLFVPFHSSRYPNGDVT